MSRTWICLRAPLKIENIFPIDSPNGGFSIGKRNAKSQFNSLHIGTGGFSSKYPSQEWKVSMDCAARPIIRKFMEADRTYSDGFIGASSNKKKMDDFFGKHSGVTHQKNGSSNRLPSLKRLWTGHEFLLGIVV